MSYWKDYARIEETLLQRREDYFEGKPGSKPNSSVTLPGFIRDGGFLPCPFDGTRLYLHRFVWPITQRPTHSEWVTEEEYEAIKQAARGSDAHNATTGLPKTYFTLVYGQLSWEEAVHKELTAWIDDYSIVMEGPGQEHPAWSSDWNMHLSGGRDKVLAEPDIEEDEIVGAVGPFESLMQLHGQTSDSGTSLPRIVMSAHGPDKKSKVKRSAREIVGRRALKTMLNRAATRANLIHTATNLVREQITAMEAKMTSLDSTSLEDRHALRTKYVEALANSDTLIKREIAYLKRAVFVPTRPADARIHFSELVESYAAARRSFIVGAIGAQGDLLDASCPTQSTALQRLAALKQQVLQNLRTATTVPSMRRITNQAKQDIRALEIDLAPVWTVSGQPAKGEYVIPWTDRLLTSNILATTVVNPTVTTGENLGVITVEVDGTGFSVPVAPTVGNVVELTYDGTEAPAYGRHTAVMTARNLCAPSDIHVHVERRKRLMKDAGWGSVNDAGGLWRLVGATPSVGSGVLTVTDDDPARETLIQTEPLDLDQNKRYDVGVTAWQETGDRIAYLLVEFLDRNSKPINNDYYSRDRARFPNGWAGFGTYCYYGVSGAPLPNTPTDYSISFGTEAGGTADIPPEAVQFRIGALLSMNGTESTVVKLRSPYIWEV